MSDQVKKIRVKAGIPLDDEKLRMVFGGTGGGDGCPNDPSGAGCHHWGPAHGSHECNEVCEYCGAER